MTLTLSPGASSAAESSRVRVAGWEIYVASAGRATARTTSVASLGPGPLWTHASESWSSSPPVPPPSDLTTSVVVRLAESDDDGGRSAGTGRWNGFEDSPLVELRLEPSGHVVARCSQAPPVLLVRSPNRAVQLPASRLGTTSHVDPGTILLALSPAVLDAMAPAEVLVAPRLLWMTPDPACLLRRWVETATGRALPGAAAAVARRTRVLPGPGRGAQLDEIR